MRHNILCSALVAAVLLPAVQVREQELQKKAARLIPAVESAIAAASQKSEFVVVVPLPDVGWRERDALYDYLRLKGYKPRDNGLFYDEQAVIIRW